MPSSTNLSRTNGNEVPSPFLPLRFEENVGLDEEDQDVAGKVLCCTYPRWLRTGIELVAVGVAWTNSLAV